MIAYFLLLLSVSIAAFAASESTSSVNEADIWATGSDTVIRFLHPNFGSFSRENMTTITESLICEAVFFTAHDADDPLFAVEDEMRRAYAEFQVGVCLISMLPPGRDDSALLDAKRAHGDFHYFRYKAAFALLSAILLSNFIHRADGSLPWVMYLDTDAFIANRRLTLDDLIARIGRGLQRPQKSTEFRFVQKHNAAPPPEGSFPQSTDGIALVWALEVFCEGNWGTNSGVLLFQPSHAALFAMAMVLEAWHIRKGGGLDGIGDQGSMNYILQNLWDLPAERRSVVCSSPLYSEATVESQRASDEIVFTRVLNFSKVEANPRYKSIADAIWNDAARGPLHVAWIPPRWMNSPACPWYLTDDNRGQLAFHAGDFICHFNSCNHVGYTTPWFRSIISNYGRDYFPTFDDNRDWHTWKAGSVPTFWVTPHSTSKWH